MLVKKLRIGVEIRGVDLSVAPGDALVAELRALYNEQHMLVFRDQKNFTPLDQWRAISMFGMVLNESQDGSGVIYVSGEKSKIESNRLLFHSDNHFNQVPIEILSLYAEEVDESATSTLFVSNADTYRDLPQSIRDRIDAAEVEVRTYFHRGYSDRPARTVRPEEDDDDGPIARHPAVWQHPVTGEKFAYLTELGAHHLTGMNREESDQLLNEIFDVMYQPSRFYEHHWRTGDYVLWNNRVLQHARGEIRNSDTGETLARSIRRVAGGTIGFTEQFQFSPEALERMEARRAAAQAS